MLTIVCSVLCALATGVRRKRGGPYGRPADGPTAAVYTVSLGPTCVLLVLSAFFKATAYYVSSFDRIIMRALSN
jgi:hypothetical protein